MSIDAKAEGVTRALLLGKKRGGMEGVKISSSEGNPGLFGFCPAR